VWPAVQGRPVSQPGTRSLAPPVGWEGWLLALLAASLFLERYSLAGISVARLTAPLAAAGALAGIRTARLDTRAIPVVAAVVAYAAWAASSGLWSVDLAATWHAVGSLAIALSYAAAFATLLRTRAQLRVLLAVVCAAGVATAVAVLIPFLSDTQARGSAGIGDPNFAAAYLLVALPLFLASSTLGRRDSLRPLRYAALALVAVGVVATLSRGGLIALGAATLAAIALPAGTLVSSRSAKLALAVGAVVLVAVTIATSGGAGARLESIVEGAGTGSGRLNEWRGAATAIREKPLAGLGLGAFEPSSNELMRATPGVDFRDFELRLSGSEAHSTYLGTTAELGVVGLVLFLALLGGTAASLVGTARSTQNRDPLVARTAAALVVSLAGWAAAVAFLSAETSRPFWVVVGVALALPTVARRAA
jgi:O-antigen ligase